MNGFENALREKIVGQEEAVQAFVDLYQMFYAGLHIPGRELVFLETRKSDFRVQRLILQYRIRGS